MKQEQKSPRQKNKETKQKKTKTNKQNQISLPMPPHASAEPALGKLGIAKLARIMQFPGKRLLVFKQLQDLGSVAALNRIADEALASASKGGAQDCDTSSPTSNKTTLWL